MSLSVITITLNEAGNIGACLDSVKFADEIIVVDSGSTDDTVAICRQAGAKVFTREFAGYGPQKNFALEQATGDWILSVDADERVPAELRDEILAAKSCDGYRVARKNFVGDAWIRHGGWFPDYSVRLFRRGKGRFNERAVHEAVEVTGTVGTLRHALIHHTCRDFDEFARRQERYAGLAAEEMWKAGRRAGKLDLLLRPRLTFLKMYVARTGFLDGWNGLRLAALYARYTRRKYELLAARRRPL